MRHITIIISSMLLCINTAIAQTPEYEYKTFVSSDGTELNYRLLRPEEEKNGEKYPLVLFLHGAGERGSDNEKQLVHGSRMFLNPVNREKYPAYILFPQCPSEDYWAFRKRPSSFDKISADDSITPILLSVREMLDTYIENPMVDRSRVYIMGLSMGGMGTFDMVIRFPEIFAAAIPICGAADTKRLAEMEGVSFRIFHGDADPTVPVECSRKAYRALKKSKCDVEYYEFPGCGHLSWDPAFNRPDFMEWLFKQKKSRKYLK